MRPRLIILLIIIPFFSFSQELTYFTLNTDRKMASAVAFSVSGKLATASHDGKVYLWNTETKAVDNILDNHKEMILRLTFSPDGNLLATGGKDKVALIWSVKSGVVKYRLTGHEATITCLSFSYDGKYIATGSADHTVKIWDVNTGNLLKTLDFHKKEVSTLCFSKSSYWLATGSFDGTIKVYNVKTDEIEKQFNPNSGRVRSLAFSPDDRLMATGTDDETVKIWDMASGTLKKTFKGHTNVVYDLEFSPDGKYLASGCLDNEVKLWSLEFAENTHSFKGFYKFLSLAFSKDGKQLAIADLDLKLRVYDISPLNIKPDPSYERWKRTQNNTSGLIASAPKISIIEPVSKKDNVMRLDAKTVTIKGKVASESGLLLLLIDGSETTIDHEGNFTKEVKLKYYDNEIVVKAIDTDKKVTEDTIFVYRIFDKNNPDEIAGMKRRGQDFALLIGTDEYHAMNQLSNPVNDVTTVANELQNNYGFKVEKVINPTLNEIYSVLRKYSKMTYANDDQLFIFIAGHGEYDDVFKEGYLVAKDSKKDDESKLTYLSHSNLRTMINNIPSKHIFLCIDACFGGTFDQAHASRGSDALYHGVSKDDFVMRKLKYKTRLYLTSGGKEYVPDGRPGQHSPFTRKVLEGLRTQGGEDKVLTMPELLIFVEKVAPEPRHGEFGDNEPGSDFLFIAR